jgi:pimeloyl-ACP methyl ester carboxylesterase
MTSPWPFISPAIPFIARTLPFHFYMPYKRLKAKISGYSTPKHRAELSEMQKLFQPRVIASRVRMVFKVDARDALSKCNVPMLYMQGTKDWIVPRGNLRRIQQIKPDIQVATIASSHMILQRHPIESAKAISAFISNLATEPT